MPHHAFLCPTLHGAGLLRALSLESVKIDNFPNNLSDLHQHFLGLLGKTA